MVGVKVLKKEGARLRLLHTSDWHIGKSLFEYSLLEDQRDFLEKLAALAVEEKADAILVSGDLFDRSVPAAQAVSLLDWALNLLVGELHIPVLAIAGNHDSPERLTFGSRLARERGLYLAGRPTAVVEKVTLTDEHGPVDFFLLPYLTPGELRPLFPEEEIHTFEDGYRVLLQGNPPTPGRRCVLIAHGFFARLGAGTELLTSESELSIGTADLVDARWLSPYTYTALGHLHRPQNTAPTIRYSGSPLCYSLSEVGDTKGVTLVVLDEAGVGEIRPIPIPPLHPVQILTGAFDALISPTFLPDEEKGHYLFAELTDPAPILHAMDKLTLLYPRLLGLRFVALEGRGDASPTLGKERAELPLPTLFSGFFTAVKGAPMSGEQASLMEDIYETLGREGDPCDR